MPAKITKTDGLKRTIHITIDKTAVDSAFNGEYSKIQKTATLPGFRAGKAPQNIIKKNYAEQVWKQVLNTLFQKFYPEALKETQIQPAGSPRIIDIQLEEGKDCALDVEAEVHPQVKVNKYLGLKIKNQKVEVTDKDLDEALKNLQQSASGQEAKSKEDKPPLPELNDEFAKRFKMTSMDELKKKIREDIQNVRESQAKEDRENQLVDKLVEANPLELPESLILDHQKSLMDNSRQQLKRYGMTNEQQETWIKEREADFKKEARRSLHSSYLFDELIKKLKVELSEKDIEKSLKESFPSKPPKEMQEELKKQNYWQQFTFNLTRKKLLDHLLEKSDQTG